jgi:hypothetical protein
VTVIITSVYASTRLNKHLSGVDESFLSGNMKRRLTCLIPGFELRARMQENRDYIGTVSGGGGVKRSAMGIVRQIRGGGVGLEDRLNG